MTTTNLNRSDAAATVVRCVRTGEYAAARELEPLLAANVTFRSGKVEITGRAAVLERLTGQWPNTPVYAVGEWTNPAASADGMRAEATFPTVGAAPKHYAVDVRFDAAGAVSAIEETITPFGPATTLHALPPLVVATINGALAAGYPIVVAYTADDGAPVLSLRGSVQVYGPTTLSLWARNATGGLVRAAAAGATFSLLYRNSPKRLTLIARGHAELAGDPAVRDRVYRISPEVEQRHDPPRAGAAVLIHLTRLQGMTPMGPVLVTTEG